VLPFVCLSAQPHPFVTDTTQRVLQCSAKMRTSDGPCAAVCAAVEVACEYRRYGCPERTQRCDYAEHMRSDFHRHMRLVLAGGLGSEQPPDRRPIPSSSPSFVYSARTYGYSP